VPDRGPERHRSCVDRDDVNDVGRALASTPTFNYQPIRVDGPCDGLGGTARVNEYGLKQRLLAILAADVAGYSRLMAADERATVAALDSARGVFRSEIELHRGRVIDMAGDSVLAVFETATGAVSAALAVQRGLASFPTDPASKDRQMRFRIGAHLGDVIE